MAENGAMLYSPASRREFFVLFLPGSLFAVFSAQAAKRTKSEQVQDLLQRQMSWTKIRGMGKSGRPALSVFQNR